MTKTTRRLKDTSWLAQTIRDKMESEFNSHGASTSWHCLNTFHVIVNEADDPINASIYYDRYNSTRSIVICKIPSLMKHGADFDADGMQCKLRGLQERYKDDDGQYLVSVLTTHDLNSATIKDVSELLYQMGTH